MIVETSPEKYVRYLLRSTHERLTPTRILRAVQGYVPGTSRAEVRAIIRAMVTRGDIKYTSHFSSTYLEWVGTHQISDRITVSDVMRAAPPSEGPAITVVISGGASFGGGEHPTTRMALRGIDHVTQILDCKTPLAQTVGLDIGTGSGVLAIAAAMLGMGKVWAVDTDLVACHEARMNVYRNGVQAKVDVVGGSLESTPEGSYDLIMANLRSPTLVSLFDVMAKRTRSGGFWVLSGFRPEEGNTLSGCLPEGSQITWRDSDRAWQALQVQLK